MSGQAKLSRVFWRFYGGLIVLVAVLAVAGAWAAIRDVHGQEIADAEGDLRHFAYLFREILEPALAKGDAAEASRVAAFAAAQDIRLTIVDPQGRVLADSDADPASLDNHGQRPEILDARRNGFGQSHRTSKSTGEKTMYAAVSVVHDRRLIGFVRSATTQSDLDKREAGRVRQAMLGAGGLACAALIVGLMFTGHLDRQFRGEIALMLERNALYDELRASQERFQLATRATSEGIWDWDAKTHAMSWNEGYYRLLACERDAVAPSFDARIDRVHPDDRQTMADSFDEFLTSDRSVWTAEYRLRKSGGSYVWVFDRAFIVRDDRGTPVRVIGSMMDVTDRKQAERMKSDFVSFVSHQLRTPLSGMNWMLELAAQSPGLPSAASDHIADARESADRLATLVNDLLDISRLESGRLQVVIAPVKVGALTRAIVDEAQPLVRDKGHRVDVTTADERTIEADEQLLRQAMGNLLSNAIKYTPSGGTIRVAVTQDNGFVQWTVTDSGIGIPKTSQARLFEKFYRAENALAAETEGTGLGLHLVRLIVDQFGGQVWCESDEGKGATFGFALPASEARP